MYGHVTETSSATNYNITITNAKFNRRRTVTVERSSSYMENVYLSNSLLVTLHGSWALVSIYWIYMSIVTGSKTNPTAEQ